MSTFPLLTKHRLGVGFLLSVVALALLLPNSLRAQVGNDNPTGPAGQFNGNVTTGGSYDPYTGNVTRTVTDLVVTGALGQYGLSWARTWNSRSGFGSWQHTYSWTIDPIDAYAGQPMDRIVTFPDGRVVDYGSGVDGNGYYSTPPGVSERLKEGPAGSSLCFLILPDGGRVEFSVVWSVYYDWEMQTTQYTYDFTAQALIDPHGLRTTLVYEPDGSFKVTEPAGRWIRHSFIPASGGWNEKVTASDGREVNYTFQTQPVAPGTVAHRLLTSVSYYDDTTAVYTYQAPNVGSADGVPLLSTCDDPMYAGPMKKISYAFATGTNPDGSEVVYGQILSEKHPNGTPVSTLTINSPTARTENRGDGPSRTFNYSNAMLINYTDFKGQSSSISYDGNGYVSAFTDARGKTTMTSREPTIGALSVLTHPDRNVNGAPYFLEIRGDERHFDSNTYFVRDPVTHRVTKIWYPDYPSGPTEEFTFNNFGQVETHTMTSGGVANFRYDTRGLMSQSWPPATPSDPNPHLHPTQYFYYTSGPHTDRLWYVIDPRGHSTRFEYNPRGQVTKVTHDQDQTYAQRGYNPDGTLAWTADENHPNASWNADERTRYTYDDYKRVISVINPLNELTTLSYAPPNGAGSHSHTTGSVYRVTSPLDKKTDFDYDENFRRKMVRKGAESTDDDGGTWFGYDEVGNLTSVQDPRGHLTTFGYDARNRRTSSTAPYPFNNQITEWKYDTRSNLIRETRPDTSFWRMEYDPQSRVIDTYGFANEHTHYRRDLAGNVIELTDPKPATYFFEYDKLNRVISATYPLDATNTIRGETWHYDWAGNMDGYQNPAGNFKHTFYDQRNRSYYSFWDGEFWGTPDRNVGPEINIGYDAASRMTSIATNGGETTVVFGYDDANRQTYEEQTVAGFPTRRVETPRNADGNRTNLHVPGFYLIRYDYTQRNQLRTIFDGNWTPWFNHSYDLAGNMARRQDVYGGVNDSTNIVDGAGVSQYDALNRPMLWEQTKAGNAAFARSHFSYDNLGRLTGSWRDEQGLKGEWFGYNTTGQLTDVSYNADGVSIGNPQNASRTVNYTIAPNTLNWLSMNDNGEVSAYTANGLNQYENVGGGGLSYDEKFNLTGLGGFSAWYDAANRLRSVTSGENQGEFIYDGLGRCLKRTVDWETILIAYDGWQPIVEWDEWHGLRAWNIYGAGPDEILYRYDAYLGVHLRYHLDPMGNVAFLLDSAGDGIERYTYDAFGHPTVTDWNGENPRPYSWYGNRFMFTGREYFAGLGIYDYRNRFYHPILGRFLQSDPIGFAGGDANLFRYCGGDPVNWIDPSGLDPEKPLYNPTEGITTVEVIVHGQHVRETPTGSYGPGPNSTGTGLLGNVGVAAGLDAPQAGISAGLSAIAKIVEKIVKVFKPAPKPKAPPKPSPNFKPPTNPPQNPPDPATLPPGVRLYRDPTPSSGYPNGYWKIEKFDGQGWQRLNPRTMKPGPHEDTHIPLPPGS
jgi:RHS repeat-associated protein